MEIYSEDILWILSMTLTIILYAGVSLSYDVCYKHHGDTETICGEIWHRGIDILTPRYVLINHMIQ